MSEPRVSIIPAAATIDKRLTALDIRILAILGREQARHGFTRLNRRQIAEWARCSEGSVPRSVRKLVSLGYVERRAAFEGKVQSANEYRTRLDQPLDYAPATRNEIATGGMEDTPDRSATGGAHVTPHPLRAAASQNTSTGGVGGMGATGDRSATGGESPPIPPLVSSPSKRPPKGGPKGSPNPPGFDEAWALWPKHHRQSSKPESLARWRKLDADPDRLLAAIRAYLDSPDARKTTPDGVAGGFVNAFEVWLNRYATFWLERTSRAAPNAGQPDWPRRLEAFQRHGFWRAAWGPRPTEPGYLGPTLSPAQEARA